MVPAPGVLVLLSAEVTLALVEMSRKPRLRAVRVPVYARLLSVAFLLPESASELTLVVRSKVPLVTSAARFSSPPSISPGPVAVVSFTRNSSTWPVRTAPVGSPGSSAAGKGSFAPAMIGWLTWSIVPLPALSLLVEIETLASV